MDQRMPGGTHVLSEFAFLDGYSTGINDLLEEFYTPALHRSASYDRAAGYFSSTLLGLIPLAFADFVEAGGQMRLLCSPHLSQRDADIFHSILPSEAPSETDLLLRNLRALVASSDLEHDLVKCLSSLLAVGAIEVRFVVPRYGTGLFHDKVGIFQDGHGNGLSFVGSVNETAAAWSGFGNHEQFEVFPTWKGADSRDRYHRHVLEFEETWRGLRSGLRVFDARNASNIIQTVCPPEPIDEIFKSIRAKKSISISANRPNDRPLRDYQEAALSNWKNQGKRGIISFATGGGKTLTAIEAIRREISTGGSCLVIVPSELLHKQWVSELKETLPATWSYLLAGAGNPKATWMKDLSLFTDPYTHYGPRIVVSTTATAISPDFLDRIHPDAALFLVADEVHNLGAVSSRTSLQRLNANARLGLSATPERYQDPEGTSAIFDFFGPVVEPTFGIEAAILEKVLVPYDYHFRTCQLTEDEQSAWDDLTKQISRDYLRNDKTLSEYGFLLLQKRARIAKGASNKAQLARDILSSEYESGDRWLVYCSVTAHLDEVRAELQDLGLPLLEYHSSNSAQHGDILQYYTRHGGVLLAMKCLDEGIDIPAVSKAIILSSSTNPREYIQRRGRVLRRFPKKYSADIYDVLVLDESGSALSMNELKRAEEFAGFSRNSGVKLQLEELSHRSGNTEVAPGLVEIDFEDTTEEI